ncbi:MAG: TRAP transporter TatT component family protein [Gammaproteobacteria bacterium]|jgi:predicted anti-sigma-YlaC factor YlaD|nr:TRAP transporter TatT component family protein [Gammaproteobacteria bacterium]
MAGEAPPRRTPRSGLAVRSPARLLARAGRLAAFLAAATLFLGGCSVRHYAANAVGDALASGPSVFETDDDVVLVTEALPFSLKLTESLLGESPRHRGLLLAASRGYLLYAYATVQFEAEQVAATDLERSRALSTRAHRLYLRAHEYALRGLEVSDAGVGERLRRSPGEALRATGGDDVGTDVGLLYAGAASLALAISTARHDPAMLARMPEVDALLTRALELDEAWQGGTLHELAMQWHAARPGPGGRARVEQHYARALELSGGRRAGVHVAYAEAVTVPAQDRAGFERALGQALAVDPRAEPEARLPNALAQRRARWLLSQREQLFLE